jgi:hypothetical protein
MKNHKPKEVADDFMREEYDFDYSKGIRGKYARKATEENGYIKLTSDMQKFFKTSEEVNNVLKAVITSIPRTRRKTTHSV